MNLGWGAFEIEEIEVCLLSCPHRKTAYGDVFASCPEPAGKKFSVSLTYFASHQIPNPEVPLLRSLLNCFKVLEEGKATVLAGRCNWRVGGGEGGRGRRAVVNYACRRARKTAEQ